MSRPLAGEFRIFRNIHLGNRIYRDLCGVVLEQEHEFSVEGYRHRITLQGFQINEGDEPQRFGAIEILDGWALGYATALPTAEEESAQLRQRLISEDLDSRLGRPYRFASEFTSEYLARPWQPEIDRVTESEISRAMARMSRPTDEAHAIEARDNMARSILELRNPQELEMQNQEAFPLVLLQTWFPSAAVYVREDAMRRMSSARVVFPSVESLRLAQERALSFLPESVRAERVDDPILLGGENASNSLQAANPQNPETKRRRLAVGTIPERRIAL